MIAILLLISIIALVLAYDARQKNKVQTKTITDLVRDLAELRSQISNINRKISNDSTPELPSQALPSKPIDSIKPTQVVIQAKTVKPTPKTPPVEAETLSWFDQILASVKDNWMVWVGGISVGLAGVFMVSHSIRSGYIGPNTQLVLALLTGLIIHAAAEYLRRKNKGTDQVFAALAGGGSITLFAALLSGIHYYHSISPLIGFIALTFVALATMALALIHGPVLAILGLTGAYAVPLLTGSDDGSMAVVLTYTLIVTLASLLLTRFIFRVWLWRATLIGALGWWLLASGAEPISLFTVAYLTVLLWAFVVIPGKNNLERSDSAYLFGLPSLTLQSSAAVLAAWVLSMANQASSEVPPGELLTNELLNWSWMVIIPISAVIAYQRLSQWFLLWATVLASTLGWLAYSLELTNQGWSLAKLDASTFGPILALNSMATIIIGAWFWLKHGPQHRWMSYTLLPTMFWFLLGYLILDGSNSPATWATAALILGVCYGVLAGVFQRHENYRPALVWAILGAHISYSLAVAFYFSEAALTLAFAFQFISLAVLAKRFELPWLYLVLKVVLAIVVARLTLNPWLSSYDIGGHWTLWTYGGATLFAVIATRIIPTEEPIRRWLEAASLHLFVLFAGTELRYWLYDGDIFSKEFSMTEVTVNMLLWGGLGITYEIRARVSNSMARLYHLFSAVLLGLSALCYVLLLTRFNPWFSGELISATPIFNILLPAYLGATLIALLLRNHHNQRLQHYSTWLAGASFLLFTLLEIRQLWNGADLSLANATSEGELYTYSVVGLIYASSAMVLSAYVIGPKLYKIGMGLLALVIAKIFLIDMSGLQGFWRVAAFMGLGLVLLALAWKYQKRQKHPSEASS